MIEIVIFHIATPSHWSLTATQSNSKQRKQNIMYLLMMEEYTTTYEAVKPKYDQTCTTVLFNMVAISHTWLLSMWNVASLNLIVL